MSAFHLYQRVRIVRSDNFKYLHLVGTETYIAAMGWQPGYSLLTSFLLAIRGEDGSYIGANEDHVEPIKHEPDAIDLMTQENAPSFDCPLPALSMLGEGRA